MKNFKLINILTAILTRTIVIAHMVLIYLSFLTSESKSFYLSIFMLIGIIFIVIEGLYTILQRSGQDWKWYSKNIFLF